MEEIRYGVIGTGMMGLEHINNVNAIDGARVVAISDPDPQSRKFGMNTARIEDDMVFEDHMDLLAAGVCDAVVLVSPNHTHADIMEDILPTHDVHVMVEKPLGTIRGRVSPHHQGGQGSQGHHVDGARVPLQAADRGAHPRGACREPSATSR